MHDRTHSLCVPEAAVAKMYTDVMYTDEAQTLELEDDSVIFDVSTHLLVQRC